MKLIWLTDIHLNFIDENARQKYYREIVKAHCDGILISGDIAEATSTEDILKEMANYIKKPIYFVLGNHDYYRGQINEVRRAMHTLTKMQPYLFWLPASDIQKLDNDTLLVGQDGWADGRYGDYANSNVVLNDSRMITELFQEKILGKYQLLKKMQELADADAKCLKETLFKAVEQGPKKIIILTHVPPFKETCLSMEKISDDNWLPYFSSKIMGNVLIKIAQQNPTIEFLVLCGHTHSRAFYQPLSNLTVRVGRAEYYYPEIQDEI